MKTLHEIVEDQARQRPQAPALYFKKKTWSYADLHRAIETWASVLRDRGVKEGDSFGLVMRNSPEFVITFFALIRLGARAVPVNFLLKAGEIEFIFQDAGAVGVITQAPFLGNVLEAKKSLPKLRDVIVTGTASGDALSFDELMATHPPSPGLPRAQDPEDIAMIIYTSGTTGKPKGAMLSHHNFIANAQQCRGVVPLSHSDTFMCLLPMFHSFAWTVCVILPLCLGSKVVIIESIKPVGEMLKQLIFQRVKIFVAVPPIFAALLRIPFWRPLRFLCPLRICISGAAALPRAVHGAFESKFGVPLLEGYGLTEASPVVTLNPLKKRVPGSVGQALPGVELRILGEDKKPLPQGEVGEICLRGENVMKGYYHQAEATADAFADAEHQWLRTGDVGALDAEGYLVISDRKKDLIIVKGLNVYPKEVEDVLLGHPAVAEAAVVGFQDETGDEIIKAFVTLKEGQVVDKTELLKVCRSQLAPYKCPKELEIRAELPKNTLGKILKRELRAEKARP